MQTTKEIYNKILTLSASKSETESICGNACFKRIHVSIREDGDCIYGAAIKRSLGYFGAHASISFYGENRKALTKVYKTELSFNNALKRISKKVITHKYTIYCS